MQFTFPILLWGMFYGISRILNRKINLDLEYRQKTTGKKILKEIKYNRRFPYYFGGIRPRGNTAGHLTEYIFIFEDNSKFISHSKIENIKKGEPVSVSIARYSGIIVDIEHLNY